MKIIYLLGVAGTGKTTLVNALTATMRFRQTIDKPIAHQHWISEQHGRVVTLGKPHPVFGGTDTLSFTAIEHVDHLLGSLAQRNVALLVGEGDRFANQRFVDTARRHGQLLLFYLTGKEDVIAQRRKQRATAHGLKEQNATWINGRLSKHHTLAKNNNATYLNAEQPTATLLTQLIDCLRLCHQDPA